jgi:hypothetical protein
MSVMSLRAKPGTLVRILATGPDEMAAPEALSAILRAQQFLLTDRCKKLRTQPSIGPATTRAQLCPRREREF